MTNREAYIAWFLIWSLVIAVVSLYFHLFEHNAKIKRLHASIENIEASGDHRCFGNVIWPTERIP